MRRRKVRRGHGNLSKKIWKIVLIFIIPLLLLDIYLLFTSRFFEIKKIEVSLDKVNCVTQNDIKSESKLLGQNFFLINKYGVEESLQKKYLCIKSVNISRRFLDKVSLDVSGREAVAVLSLLKNNEATSSGILESLATSSADLNFSDEITEQFLVDREGIVFSKFEGQNVPKIYIFRTSLSIGKKVEENIVENSLKILQKLKSFGVDIVEARIYEEDTLIIAPEASKPKIIFALEEDIDVQLASLQLILIQAKIEEQEMEFIDLRYDKPIVKYVPKKGG